MNFRFSTIALVTTLAWSATALAQVNVVSEPYVPPAGDLPFAPAAKAKLEKLEPVKMEPLVPKPVFDVTTSDSTIRDVLVRWATAAGWTHKPDHWAIDRDLPIAGTADSSVFGPDFKEATRKLLLSTELTDRAVQPCFYSNKVVRVVARAELCDKTSNSAQTN
jgi:hypothetical protein